MGAGGAPTIGTFSVGAWPGVTPSSVTVAAVCTAFGPGPKVAKPLISAAPTGCSSALPTRPDAAGAWPAGARAPGAAGGPLGAMAAAAGGAAAMGGEHATAPLGIG